MDIVTIDFETYYSQEFSLSRMTTEEYVRSSEFEVIGVSVKVNNGPTDWYTGADPGTFLKSLDYSDKAILCHNTAFDGAILSWHYNIKPKLWLDTLSMAKPGHAVIAGGSLAKLTSFYHLGQKGTEVVDAKGKRRADFTPAEMQAYGNYCCNDTELTYKLFKILAKQIPVSELMVIDQTIRMYTEPKLVLDRQILEEHLIDVKAAQTALLNALGGDEAKMREVLNSNDKFAKLLTKLGVAPPMKMSKTTSKPTYAFAKTDPEFTDLQEHDDPRVQLIVAARLGTKSTIEETRTKRLIGVSERGPLPIMLNYYGAHTGRFSGGDKLNLQNLPSRKNNAIRRAIKAPDGKLLIACDSAQIEARVVAWLAEQDNLVEAFREGRDVYSEFATAVYGYKVDKARKVERFVGKTCILGLGYSMGYAKFRDTLASGVAGMVVDMTEHEARRVVYLYREKNQRIKNLWEICEGWLTEMVLQNTGTYKCLEYGPDGIKLPNGLYLKYNGLRDSDEGGKEYISDQRAWVKYVGRILGGSKDVPFSKIYGGKVTENVVQALARIVVVEQMVEIGKLYPVLFQVHDENVVLVDAATAESDQQVIEKIMSTPPAWAPDLPVACESHIGASFGDTK